MMGEMVLHPNDSLVVIKLHVEDKTVELQFITHFTDTYSYYDSALALEGGCRWIQLRMKNTPVDEVEREAIRLQGLCKDYGRHLS